MNFDLKFTGGNENAKIELSQRVAEKDLYFFDVKMTLDKEDFPKKFTVEWRIPMYDIYSTWNPTFRTEDPRVAPEWWPQITDSRLASGLPTVSVLSASGNNRMAIALSDAKTPVRIRTGACENSAFFVARIDFFTIPVSPLKEYNATIRVDLRDIPYYDSIYDVVKWWEVECGYIPANVPEHATLPMNSLWYSFHQELSDNEDIFNECRLSKALGMDTVIVDDGWQCDNDNRGYAYCGDWEVIPTKIPDMKEFVDKIHETGMKMILWYSVPFIGVHSKNYERFKDMLLDGTGDIGGGQWRSFDPRYPEVREFLVSTYVKALREWGLDGFKLDFIDSFELRGKSLEYDARRDYQSLEDAVDMLMTEVKDALTAIKSDIMIEFRQRYIGPAIRKFGNMLRVADCPNDAFTNRLNIVNLRYTSGNTAVHSDMLMWHYDEPVESAALQFVNILYSVPQVSMRIARLREDHKKMLAYYLAFWRENRDTLMNGKIIGEHPESHYTTVRAEKDGKAIITAYSSSLVDCAEYEQVIAVNGTGCTELLLRGANGRSYKVVNCMGEELACGRIDGEIFALNVAPAGIVFIEK